MEIRKDISVHEVDNKCMECGGGYYRPIGIVLYSDPLKYPHECNNCGHIETFNCKYPKIVYEYH